MLKAIARIIDFVTWIVCFLLVARFVTHFFGTKSDAPLIEWLYGTTTDLISPFANFFGVVTIGSGYKIDSPAIVAVIIYGIVGYGLVALLDSIANHFAFKPKIHEMVSPNPTAPSVIEQKPINEPVDLKTEVPSISGGKTI